MSNATGHLNFACPRCQVILHVDPARAGETMRCEHCQAELVIPGSRPALAEPFDDLFELDHDGTGREPRTAPHPVSPTVAPSALPADLLAELGGPPQATPAHPERAADQDFELLPLEDSDHQRRVANQPALDSGADPFAEDDDAPIRLDGVTAIDPHERMVHVRCPVCDSVMLAAASQIGALIQCTDCHSSVLVTAENTEAKPGRAAPQFRPQTEEPPPEPDLSPFPDLGPGMTEPLAATEDYVLAPLTEDHLRPRVDESLLSEAGVDAKSAASRPRPISNETPRRGIPEAKSQAARPDRPATPATTPATTPPAAGSAAAAAPTEKRSEYDHRLSDSIDSYEQEMRKNLEDNEPIDEAQLFRFPDQFLAPFRDVTVWIYFLLLAFVQWAMIGLFSGGSYLTGLSDNGVQVYSAIGLLVKIIGVGVGILFTLVAGVVINQLVEAAAYKRSVFHPPEIGILAWLTSFSVVGVSLYGAGLVGAVLGAFVGSLAGAAWPGWLVGGAFALLLMPIGILSAYYNGSPLKIFSPVVVSTMRTHRDGWIRFYRWMGVWLLFAALMQLLVFIPAIGTPLVAVARAATVILVGRTIGLLAQAFVINWIRDE